MTGQSSLVSEHSTVSGVAGRYARALFELALDAKSVDAVKADIEKFDAMIAESADLHRLVRSPVFGAEERSRALAAVLAKAGIGGLPSNFLMFVTANRRLFSVGEMIRDFRKLVAQVEGRGDRRGHRRRDSCPTRILRRSRARSNRSPARRRSISTSRSIRRSSAG